MATRPMLEEATRMLHKWATEEMHFRPQGRHTQAPIPTVEDFKEICRGPMAGIWHHVVEQVYSTQTVRKVQGNLALKAHQGASGTYKVKYGSEDQYSADKAELLEQKKKTASELEKAKADIGHVEKDLERLQKEILHTDHSYREACNRLTELEHRQAILNSHSQHCKEEMAKYEEYTKRIRGKVKDLNDRISKSVGSEVYLSKPAGSSVSARLETSCSKTVQETCDNIATFLSQMLQGNFSEDKTSLSKKKESLWHDVGEVVLEHPPVHILLSLVHNTREAGLQLRAKTAAIDISKDAEKLRFKYQSGGLLVDNSCPPRVIQSVQQLLEEGQVTHIKRFVDTERSKNQAWRTAQRMEKAKTMVDHDLQRSLRTSIGAIDMARRLLEIEVETAAARAALRCLEDSCGHLQESIHRALQEEQSLYSKYLRIQDFTKLADSKQNLILVLVKQNTNSAAHLATQRKEILQYVQSALSYHESNTRSHVADMKHGVIMEVEGFAKLMLPFLMCTVLESAYKMAVLDLSIHRLRGVPKSPHTKVILQVLSALEFPTYQAPENLLENVVRLHNEVKDIAATLHAQKMLASRLDGHHSDETSMVGHINALCKKVADYDKSQLERVLPSLQRRITQTMNALPHCLQVKESAQAWWEQPAQNTTPWLTHNKLTLQQWRDKWTVAVTRLRQLQFHAQ